MHCEPVNRTSSFRIRAVRRATLGVALALCGAGDLLAAVGAAPDFGRDVFPILRRRCFECHGPAVQEAGLRLDEGRSALDPYSAIVPGDAENSELFRRTTLPAGHDEIMPAIGKPLSKTEIETLRLWIDAGAAWPEKFEPA